MMSPACCALAVEMKNEAFSMKNAAHSLFIVIVNLPFTL
jgi:hypothetical protein